MTGRRARPSTARSRCRSRCARSCSGRCAATCAAGHAVRRPRRRGLGPSLRLPGLRRGEAVRRRSGRTPQRASVLAADGTRLDARRWARRSPAARGQGDRLGLSASTTSASAATRAPSSASAGASWPRTGRARPLGAHDDQAGAAARGGRGARRQARWRGGRAPARRRGPRARRASRCPRPSRRARRSRSSPSRPRSHTASRPRRAPIPIRTFATLSGVKLRNASGEACGGTLDRRVCGVVQLGVRSARCQDRGAPAGRNGPRVRIRRAPEGAGRQAEHDLTGRKAARQPRRRRRGDRPGPRSRHAAGDGLGRRDDRHRGAPRAAADHALEPVLRRRVISSRVAHRCAR